MYSQREMYFHSVDIVICVDATSGMSRFIEQLRENALLFDKQISASMKKVDLILGQTRVKVVAFRNYKYDEEPMVESPFYELPWQNEELLSFVSSVEAKGGGNTTGKASANALEAIALALKSDWNPSGTRRRHAVLVFSDAPALPLGEGADSALYPSGMPRDFNQLTAWWEGSDPNFKSMYQPWSGRLVAFVPQEQPWTDVQLWDRSRFVYSHKETRLDDVDILSAIDLLVSTF